MTELPVPVALPADWYQLVLMPGVDLRLPGIYLWVIEGTGTYVGKFTHSSRPLREYERNVLKLLNGRPYRPKKPDAFRRIHRALHRAHLEGKHIQLILFENCAPADLNRRELELIAERGTLNGPEK